MCMQRCFSRDFVIGIQLVLMKLGIEAYYGFAAHREVYCLLRTHMYLLMKPWMYLQMNPAHHHVLVSEVKLSSI